MSAARQRGAARDGAPFRVLVVCSGNVCRSPLAELLLRGALGDRGDLVIASAGTVARPGMGMTAEMVHVAAARGIPEADARAHRASRLDEEAVSAAGLVLGLTRAHRAAAVELHPAALRRAFTLSEFARLAAGPGTGPSPGTGSGPDERLTVAELVADLAARRGGGQPVAAELDDIRDPIGLPQEVYDEVGGEIACAVVTVADALSRTREAPAAASGALPAAGEDRGPEFSFAFRRR
jgi:protein-tyrosine phosphatase